MTSFIQLIIEMLTEGGVFLVSVFNYYTDFVALIAAIAGLGAGINPAFTVPILLILPVTLVVICIKFILRRGK